MPVVLDSNVLLAQAVETPYAGAARKRVRSWIADGVAMIAPALWPYEVASGLRRLIVHGRLSEDAAGEILARLDLLGVESRAATIELQRAALSWADRLGHGAAYDAAYLALAEQLGAPLWTADGRLARSARSLGTDWVRDISD